MNSASNSPIQTLTPTQHATLKALFPHDASLTTEELCIFGSDASRLTGHALAVVRPENEEQLVELLRFANAYALPVYPRARATNVVGACVPTRPGIVISTLRMNRIIEINPQDFVAVVQPGVVTADLQRAVEAQGLFYPPDPASLGISTIGGNVGTCAGGMRAVRYGVTRDYVLGLRAVLPSGKVLACGSRCHKNVVGLDLVRLMVGSEGTLGCFSEITLKLLPRPEASASLLAGFADMSAALQAVERIFQSGTLPVALEFMGPEVLHCASLLRPVPWPDSVRAALLIRLDGDTQTLPSSMERLQQTIAGNQQRNTTASSAPIWSSVGIGTEQEEPLWQIRRSINPASFRLKPDKLSDDVTVPRGSLHKALKRIRDIGQEYELTILTFGHVGDGNIHVNIMHDANNPDERANALAAKTRITDCIMHLNGSLSGEHGIGLTKYPYVHRQLSELERELMAGIKKLYDPIGIMNPQKAF